LSPINPYFSSGKGIGANSEQRLVESLVIESLKIYGQEIYYLPRTLVDTDEVFLESVMSKFTRSYPIEMYLNNVQGWEGNGELFSKFGIQVTDQATFVVAKRRWEDTVLQTTEFVLPPRPMEGDLLYFPLTKSFFEIKFAQHLNPFYQLGKFYVYSLQCELFTYSSELVQTGNGEIDELMGRETQDQAAQQVLTDGSNTPLLDEGGAPILLDDPKVKVFDQDDVFQNEGDNILDFSEHNPFGEV
jgi:hypothetical protein